MLYRLGILQRVVDVLGGGLGWLLGTEQAASVNAAANIVVGQTEAPLVIRPYVAGSSRSDRFAVMVGGLDRGGVGPRRLLAARRPARLPHRRELHGRPQPDEREPAQRAGQEPVDDGTKARNVIDAAANGATVGLRLAATIGAMLLAFIWLIALLNLVVGGIAPTLAN